MIRLLHIALLFSFIASCAQGNREASSDMDCDIKKIIIYENDSVLFEITDPINIDKLIEIIQEKESVEVKFKPKFWVEIPNPDCKMKVGVARNYLKLDGRTYSVQTELEDLLSKLIAGGSIQPN